MYRIPPKRGRASAASRKGKQQVVTVASSGEGGGAIAAGVLLPLSPVHGRKRPSQDDVSDMADDFIKLSFSSTTSVLPGSTSIVAGVGEFDPLLDNVNQLLLPEDERICNSLGKEVATSACLMTMFQSFTIAIWMKKQIKDLSGRLKTMRAELSCLRSRNEEVELANKGLKGQLDACKSKVAELKDVKCELQTVKGTVTLLEKRLEEVADDMEIQVRGEMARDFVDGVAGTWDVDQFIADHDAYLKKVADEKAEADGLGVTLKAMVAAELALGGQSVGHHESGATIGQDGGADA